MTAAKALRRAVLRIVLNFLTIMVLAKVIFGVVDPGGAAVGAVLGTALYVGLGWLRRRLRRQAVQ